MPGSIFFEVLRRHWRATLLWGVGIASMALYIVVLIPDSKILKQYGELMKSMPSFLINAMGGGDASFMATPAGFLAYAFFGWIMLVMAVYAVLAGLNITANEEDRGILDVLLSMPLPRWRIIFEKFMAYTLFVLVILVMSFAVLWWGVNNPSLAEVTPGQIAMSILNMVPPTLLVMAFTAFIATVVRRRSTAAAISAVFVGFSYFVDVLGRSAESADVLRTFSYYKYYDSTAVMQHGLVPANVALLSAVALILFVGALWAFQRRDVGV